MYESHEDDEKEDEDEDEDTDFEEDAEELVFGGASPKHGIKPKLQGVPLLT